MQETVIHELIAKWGYMGIFGGMFLEGLTIPFPGALFVLLGGVMAAKLQLDFWLVAFLAILGYFVGTLLPYYLAMKGGRHVLHKYGKYVFLTPRKLQTAEFWFEKYGTWVVCFSRPFFFGNYVSYLAGLAKMRFGTYMLFTLLGILPWCLALSGIGYYSGQGALLMLKEYGAWAALIFSGILLCLAFAYKGLLTWLKTNHHINW